MKLCKTNHFKYFSEIMNLLGSELPSPPTLRYLQEIFLNPNRVKDFLIKKYSKFSFESYSISDNCSIFFTDPKSMICELLSNPLIINSLFFDTSRKNYLDNIFDGDALSRKSKSNTIFLIIYYDDFAPLLNSLSSNAQSYKCSTIYLKIANISPLFASKRSCVLPFAIFYAKDFNSNKVDIFKFIVSKLNVFLDNGCIINGSNYYFSFVGCSSDNLAAHELLGMSGFSATHFCRFCTMSKEEVQEVYHHNPLLSRDSQSFDLNLKVFQKMKSNKQIRHLYSFIILYSFIYIK